MYVYSVIPFAIVSNTYLLEVWMAPVCVLVKSTEAVAAWPYAKRKLPVAKFHVIIKISRRQRAQLLSRTLCIRLVCYAARLDD